MAEPARAAVTIRGVAVQQEADGTAVEITSNGTLVPTIAKLDGPPRIVIDLPGAINTVPRQLGAVAQGIRGVRINQFQLNPPIARVVIDLAEPRNYVWEMVQDKLLVHLRPPDKDATAGPSTPAFAQGVVPAGTTDAGGAAIVTLAGNRIAPGSSITAGEDTAVLNLSRGGQVRVCPGTTVSVTTSRSGRNLMLGMSTGAVETHYVLPNSADSVLTPDFRIVLPGPGEFHYAVSADSKGNTCVRALPGNTSPAIVSELIGNGKYQVKPTEEVVFRGGQLTKIDTNVPMDCGCPREQVPVLRAEATTPIPIPTTATTDIDKSPSGAPNPTLPPSSSTPTGAAPSTVAETRADAMPETAPLPALRPNEQRVIVQAPLVFRASDPPASPIKDARKLPASSRRSITAQLTVLPPVPPLPAPGSSAAVTPAKSATQSRGFFGSIKRFFAKIFG